MQKSFLLILLLTLCAVSALAQGKLVLYPKSIEFSDPFHRLNNVYFINNGDSAITIKDISYNSDAYFVRFNKFWSYPIILQPRDTLVMDCILQSYYLISPPDLYDTMSVYGDNKQLLAKINISIGYYDNISNGEIVGHISDGMNPVSGAKVFFYNRNLVAQTAITDINGYYSALLKPGEYKISAQQDSFYVTFYGQYPSPYNAVEINLKSDSVKSADIVLRKMISSGISVSGQVYDLPTFDLLRRGIVVIQHGTHTPSKISAGSAVNTSQPDVYTAAIQYDGSYKVNNISQTGYYYVQVLSDYFIPAYYNLLNNPTPFWQKADTLLVNSSPQGINIYLARDSAFGNGTISGKILLNNSSDSSNTEIIVLAQSLNIDSSIVAYGFTDLSGNFTISNLQYGKYQLRAQKIGFTDIYSGLINIDSVNPSIGGVEMSFNLAGLKISPSLPTDFQLLQNYPNPFNPSTTIEYFLPQGMTVRLRIINVLGQEVSTLINGYSSAGNHKITFNGSKLSSGIYFMNLSAGDKSVIKKIVLLK
jgi:hypothetical protein